MSKNYKFALIMEKWIKKLRRFLIICLGVFLITHYLSSHINILHNYTDSLPQRYFIHFLKVKPKKNEYTVAYSDWLKENIIKQIIGVAGDNIHITPKGEIYINDFKVGRAYAHASDGRPLTAVISQKIPPGYVFLYSPHIRSFDSRYQELGLVPEQKLKGRALPLS